MSRPAEARAVAVAEECFLCAPHPWVYAESESFVALLGLGPIGEGYSLIAARHHVPSMLDLEGWAVDELVEFTAHVRGLLWPHYGDAVITEHGRIAPCLAAYARTFEPHCLHAHRLVFPGQARADLVSTYPGLPIREYPSFEAAYAAGLEGQYLYAEGADGACEVIPVAGPIPRQFFRRHFARRLGIPDAADWNAYPAVPVVESALAKLS